MPYRHPVSCFLLAGGLTAALLSADPAAASNLCISHPRWIPADSDAKTAAVLFDIQWDNSWRASWRDGDRSVTNWDAAWIFLKLRAENGLWQHLPVALQGHQAPAGSAIQAPDDRAGVFLHGTNEYRGPMKLSDVRLAVDSRRADVKPNDFHILGVEMVLIPEKPFLLGNGPRSIATFFRHPPPEKPFPVESEAAIPLGNRNDALTFHPNHYNPEVKGTLPEAFPKGYRAFYCMKYGLRWESFAQILNMLTFQQATNLFPIGDEGYFTGSITGTHPHVKAADPARYCSGLCWPEGAAMADWCGLRPMTELEYEKAFRGSFARVQAEMEGPAMGDLMEGNAPEEEIGLTGSAPERKAERGYWVDFEWGPFPKGDAKDIAKGTMYYGVMASSFCEQCVTVGHELGWGFRGMHGDGNLSGDGFADVPDWPDASGLGSGYRGRYGYSSPSLRVIDRTLAAHGRPGRGHGEKGWRSVRTAP